MLFKDIDVSEKDAIFNCIQDKSLHLKRVPLDSQKNLVNDIGEILGPYSVSEKVEGRNLGVIARDCKGNAVYLKIEEVSLVKECLSGIFYYLGIGPKTSVLDTYTKSQVFIISQGLLNSNKQSNDRRITPMTNGAALLGYVDTLAKLFKISDIGTNEMGINNVFLVNHQNKIDFQIKILDFEVVDDNGEISRFDCSNFYENLDLKHLISKLIMMSKVKLSKEGTPLTGKERKSESKATANLVDVIEYGFKTGIKNFLERKNIFLPLKELNLFLKIVRAGMKDIKSIDSQILKLNTRRGAEHFFFSYQLCKNNNKLFSFLMKNEDFRSLSINKSVNNIENLLQQNFPNCNEKQIKEVKCRLESLNSILFKLEALEKEIEVKKNALNRDIESLFPGLSISFFIMKMLKEVIDYRENVLEPRVLTPLIEYYNCCEKINVNLTDNILPHAIVQNIEVRNLSEDGLLGDLDLASFSAGSEQLSILNKAPSTGLYR